MNVCAFLDTIAWSEGTDTPGQPSRDRGYDVLAGGGNFSDYDDHPRQLIFLPTLGVKSSAAGRYQLLERYYDVYRRLLKLQNFSPAAQDRIAVQQIREQKALPLIQAGDFVAAAEAMSFIWPSLPGAGGGQHEHSLDDLLAMYQQVGGVVTA
ncbi:glycoside hydrolase family 24 protein [Xylophilus rhododendri]|nr:glycoside hydrolase family 104 protein [Xylophilus rhododendri]